MRVLHVTPYFAPAFGFGGPPQSIHALCKALVAHDVDVEVLTTTANPGRELPPQVDGTEYDTVPVRYFPVSAPRKLLGSRAMHTYLHRTVAAADAVHVHGLFNATSWSAASLARRHRRPLVVSVRGMLEAAAMKHHRLRKQAAWRLFDRGTVHGAAVLHCTSELEWQGLSASGYTRATEIPNPVALSTTEISTADRVRLRGRLGVPADARIVLFLGRLHPIKRLDLAAGAFARVATRFRDAHLVVAGPEDGVSQKDVRAGAGGASRRVHCVGPVYGFDRDVLLSDASTLVLCSDSENFGMSVAQALAAGVPPVVTQTCPWSMLESSRSGRWVLQTEEGIARGVEDVLSDASGAAAMGARGRALVADRFSPASVASRWRTVYERLC
jgi:glycosyltransferase involved in cell wall biosynthesis